MSNLIPDEEGKVRGWKLPTGIRKVGDSDRPNACPICGTEVESAGLLGQGSSGSPHSPEPWRDVARCPECKASLERHQGDPWTATAA